ncbi:MAG: TerB N-terminal domain-containing protein [Clostridia bacterium]|nr:TerB N-terminal domain-containing protein [Clostridia bacterium]
MDDIKAFIEKITVSLDSARRHIEEPDGAEEKIYRDEPILTTAAKAREALPEKYREMRRIGEGDPALLVSESKRFVAQAKFMEDFEDSYEYNGEFFRYFPTYRHMSDRQLRGYFSWRTDVRRGIVKETSLSFVYVYIYELINLIGTSGAKDAIDKLDTFVAAYLPIDRSIRRYTTRWRRDMAIYYGVPEALCDEKAASKDLSALAEVLSNPREAGEDAVFKALSALSSVNPEKSARYRSEPERTKALFYRIYLAYFEFCGEKRKIPLVERLLGKKMKRTYIIFPSAVFYDKEKNKDYDFVSPGGTVYRRRHGEWTAEGFPETGKKSSAVGALVREIDASLKEYDEKNGKIGETVSKVFAAIARREILRYEEEKRKEAASRIEFDFSALDKIRAGAEETASKLVTEDEFLPDEDDFLPEYMETVTAEDPPAGSPGGRLDGTETEILRLIIEGKDASDCAKSRGTILSVVVDSINEKLYEEFFDNVIEYDGKTPSVVEDYVGELKGVIGE